jgi:hypothetical protein
MGLPGFIIGYASLADGPLATAPMVYAATLGWSLVSVVVVAMLILAFKVESGMAHVLIGGAAGLIYYWFAGPTMARELGAGTGLSLGIRLLGMGLVAFWLARTVLAKTNSSPGTSTRPVGWKQIGHRGPRNSQPDPSAKSGTTSR